MKDVKGFEDHFSITIDGDLWSKRTGKFLKQTISKTGYYTVATKIGGRNGQNICFKVHRVVAEAYIDNPENKPVVNHKDGNKLNNSINNLEWCTYKENSIHAFSTGLVSINYGIDVHNSKLTNEQVEYIRSVYISRSKIYGCRALAKRFDVSHRCISHIVNSKTYKK